MKTPRPDYSERHPSDPGPIGKWEKRLFAAGLIAPWVAVVLHLLGWIR
jgi:hypothetical protein